MPVQHHGNARTITEELTIRFHVDICDDYFANGDPAYILGFERPGHRVVFMDTAVSGLYGSKINEFFKRHKIVPEIVTFSVSDRDRTLNGATRMLQAFQLCDVPPSSEPLIIIGGGALLTMARFGASLDRRRVPYVAVPTTAQMWDTALSANALINFGETDTIASFHAAKAVIIDRRFLNTLPVAHVRDGIAAQVRVGAIADPELFGLLETHGRELIRDKFQGTTEELDLPATRAIDRTIAGTLGASSGDIGETDPHRHLLCGQTWGPVLEMQSIRGPGPMLPGEGMSIDIALTAVLSWMRGLLRETERDRVLNLLTLLDLPLRHHLLRNPALIGKANEDARRMRGSLSVPLLTGIGQCEFSGEIRDQTIQDAIEWLFAYNGES